MHNNNDCFDNIEKVYYKNEPDPNAIHCNRNTDIIYEFESLVGKYLVDNLKIPPYKPKGYIFNDEKNMWNFKIIVITTNNIYTANRYINDTLIGFF